MVVEKLIAGIFGFSLGVFGLWTAFRLLKNRSLLNQWKTTKGRVIERGIFRPDHAMLSTPAFRYSPLVRYSYEVGGREFVSNTILPRRMQLPRHSSKKWAQREAESFPEEVAVYYNPEDPAESYLILTSSATLFVVIAASCLALIIGLSFLLATIA